ncbi:GTP cyclohydrolase II [Recurvomyces mirabilis]|nr:GTP cyclohydrolase II [Recurvomyces mirabilis]
MQEYPAHASPAFTPIASTHPTSARERTVSYLKLSHDDEHNNNAPPPLISPAFTPPQTPFHDDSTGQRHDRQPRSIPVSSPTDFERQPTLLPQLPHVECQVRARIPTTTGQEMFLHLYHNSADDKEHLAIVFGPNIRSKSLDAPRPGETERDRMIRGAYVGTLFPGRTHSRVDQIRQESGAAAAKTGGRPSAGYLSGLNGPGQGPPSPTTASEVSAEGGIDSSYPEELGPPMVRIHSECYTGETVWSARCDCGEQLDEAARLMSLPAPTPISTPSSENGEQPLPLSKLPSCGGVIIYLRQEGRGIGLKEKLKAYNLQDLGHDTMEANILLRHPGDARSYGLATAMLMDLGLDGERGIKLLTNNPEKVRAVEGPNREVRVVERVPMIPLAWKTGGKEGVQGVEVERYISTKIEKFKHMFSSG